MPKLRLLLIDAVIVIHLHRFGLWKTIVETCDVHLSRGIVNESRFYYDQEGVSHPIDLQPDEDSGRIVVHEVLLTETKALRDKFGQDILQKLDAGEAELLAVLANRPLDEYQICSADRIVYRVLGALRMTDQGISLEEVLKAMGMTKAIDSQFSKAFREKWSQQGFTEGITGLSSL